MLSVLLESGLRTAVLGAALALILKLFRIRSVQAQLTVWIVVLVSACFMPILMQWTTITFEAPPAATKWVAPPPAAAPVITQTAAFSQVRMAPSIDWIGFASSIYFAIASVLLLRLFAGLFLSRRMARSATVVTEGWTGGMDVRVGAVLAPVTFGSTILLPETWSSWHPIKRQAVLLHERSHVERGDFYLQLFAQFHRAIFWFSPFAWWLQNRIAELGELASDDAAVQEMPDRAAYAEILIDLAAKNHHYQFTGVSMARPRTVARRVERILSETMIHHRLGRLGRVAIGLALLPLIGFIAGCSMRSSAQTAPTAPAVPVPAPAPVTPTLPAPPRTPAQAAAARRPAVSSAVQAQSDDSFAIVTSNGRMNGYNVERSVLELVRDRIQGDFIWFRRGEKSYYVSDPALIRQALELYRPQEELGRRQAELGAQQAQLGAEQSRLGVQQAAVAVQAPDLTKHIDELRARLGAISGRQLRQDEIGKLQADIGNLQARVGELQARAGGEQALLAAQQAALGANQAALGARQAELGQRQAAAAAETAARVQMLLDEALRNGQARPVE